MADYIYLLENRLAPAQKNALHSVREVARAKGLTIFLVGGAVRDLTSGSPVRDLDVVIQGNALKLRKELEKAGAVISGEFEAAQALFLRFPGGVRMEFGSTVSISYPKPGKAVAKPATILEDLRRRDFTANAMALSLNDGSYGLLMDPANGVADIENRQLRLVSPYGFIEDPVRMIRAARLMARLGWTLDERTESRYETGKQENYIQAMPEFHRGYELEEIVHEEDPLRVMRRLEAEGWLKVLAPYWTPAKVNVPELERMREAQTQLQMQGIHPDGAAANFPLLTARLSAKEVAGLRESFPRKGFVQEIETLEAEARDFSSQLGGKGAAAPSQAWKLITSAKPEVVLWAAFSNKSPAIQAKFKSFSSEWPQARQKMPYAMMQEMRITPELPEYEALLEKLFFELMDGNLSTAEEMKAFLEPYSPPAPPPPVNLRRQRAAKKESKGSKSRSKKAVQEAETTDADDLGFPALTEGEEPDDETAEDSDPEEVAGQDDVPVATTSAKTRSDEQVNAVSAAPTSTRTKKKDAQPAAASKGAVISVSVSTGKAAGLKSAKPTAASAKQVAPAKAVKAKVAKSAAKPSESQAKASSSGTKGSKSNATTGKLSKSAAPSKSGGSGKKATKAVAKKAAKRR